MVNIPPCGITPAQIALAWLMTLTFSNAKLPQAETPAAAIVLFFSLI